MRRVAATLAKPDRTDLRMHEFWANTIVVIHLGYMAFVVVGLGVILLGMFRGWQWIRNPWFRFIHLAMILIVAFEAVIDFECPLTTWERDMRKAPWRPVLAPLRISKAVAVAAAPLAPGPVLATISLQVNHVPENPQSFVGRLIGWIMFPDIPESYLTAMYYFIAVVVLATIVLAPPRWRRRHESETSPARIVAP